MPNLGWSEMLVIVVVLLLVVGPRELPRILALAAKQLRGARKIAREFQQALESAVYDEEVKEIQEELKGQMASAQGDLDKYGKALDGEVAATTTDKPVDKATKKQDSTRGTSNPAARLSAKVPTLPADMPATPTESASEAVSEPVEVPSASDGAKGATGATGASSGTTDGAREAKGATGASSGTTGASGGATDKPQESSV